MSQCRTEQVAVGSGAQVGHRHGGKVVLTESAEEAGGRRFPRKAAERAEQVVRTELGGFA